MMIYYFLTENIFNLDELLEHIFEQFYYKKINKCIIQQLLTNNKYHSTFANDKLLGEPLEVFTVA